MIDAREQAETVALQALAWLAGNDDLFGVFLGASGSRAADIATRAGEPEFLASVLDFVLMDDAWIVGFCDDAGIEYERPIQLRHFLPGGALPEYA
ncbi:MAG: DUF3572 domain-containing protein [Paracoccaceae bacterium]